MARDLKAPRGDALNCKNWRIEALLRMLHNNLENAERPDDLIIYGGTGKAARNWECFDAIVDTLKGLAEDETLLIQSGKPVGVFRTFENSPRVLICNSNLVGNWSNWEHFNQLEANGLMMYGQMTAGSWCYIGTQGIIQGTYETFAALAEKHFGGTLAGKFCLTGGMGGMSGAQPLSIKMMGGVGLVVEVDPKRIKRRLDAGFCDITVEDLDEALELVTNAKAREEATSIGLVGNCADVLPELLAMDFIPDVVTDQTSAHDELNGYVPKGYWGSNLDEAEGLRNSDPKVYVRESMESMRLHCKAIVGFQKKGAVAFDYGNNLRGQARKAGFADAFAYPGFVLAYIRPLFCEGRGPFRWVALTGAPEDVMATDRAIIEMFPDNRMLVNWIELAERFLPWEGLPARVCWLGYGERHRFGKRMNEMVKNGEIGPIAITRDHLDAGSVASPYRETEAMDDGTDAVADWPLLNALLNCASGADMVAVHNGGGVGIGLSQHAGMMVVCDGSQLTGERIERVFRSDPGTGVMRHADAGYDVAVRTAREKGVRIPFLNNE
ncbi:MAG: urocanate hydratase [Candidatus Proteinoplasmatales archaeon SG8-5]|nr:MAG: urocanate hydratase [Candidatus Proteinoplasmatales archaeon SG8-5]